jgi:hypothetical protein
VSLKWIEENIFKSVLGTIETMIKTYSSPPITIHSQATRCCSPYVQNCFEAHENSFGISSVNRRNHSDWSYKRTNLTILGHWIGKGKSSPESPMIFMGKSMVSGFRFSQQNQSMDWGHHCRYPGRVNFWAVSPTEKSVGLDLFQIQ